MNKRSILTLCLVGFTALTYAKDHPAPARPLTVAVLDFQSSQRDSSSIGADAAALLNSSLSSSGSLMMVERQDLQKILGEQELGMGGTVTPESAAKVGQLLGARILITGRIFNTGEKLNIVAKIMSTETGRVFGESEVFQSPDALNGAITALTPKIQDTINKHADVLIAKVEEPDERIERLKKIVQGAKLPSVRVQITEQHINHAIIDPAAQTEMQTVLKQIGFEVTDSRSATQDADVVISGEAFSEMAGRFGNLVACRSRAEIKINQSKDGKLLLSDRQTSVAADIAESVAGKSALQNASLLLLDRIVPVLAKVQK